MQGLGLLINLVEYSSRNRHCLVELEVDSSCLPETEKDGKTEEDQKEHKVDKAVEDNMENRLDTKETSSALTALVQVCVQLAILFVFQATLCLMRYHDSPPGGSSLQESPQ